MLLTLLRDCAHCHFSGVNYAADVIRRAEQRRTAGARRAPDVRPIKAVVFYEEFAAAIDAKEVVARISRHFRDDFDLEMDFWKLGMVDCGWIREHAAPGVACADMIVFATAGMQDLSENAKAWLEDCLAQRRSGGLALVALFARKEVATNALSPMAGYLQKLAAQNHLEFISNRNQGSWQDPRLRSYALHNSFALQPNNTPITSGQWASGTTCV
jgi:hypothetical protein